MAYRFLDRFKDGKGFLARSHKKEIPVGFKQPESLTDTLARLLRSKELEQIARSQGYETFQEADDFDVDDDIAPMPNTPYEADFDHATIHAMERGVVQRPSDEQLSKAKDVIETVKKARTKPKPNPDATPPAKEAGAPVGSQIPKGAPAE